MEKLIVSIVSMYTDQNINSIDALAMNLRKKFVEELLGVHCTIQYMKVYETGCINFIKDGF